MKTLLTLLALLWMTMPAAAQNNFGRPSIPLNATACSQYTTSETATFTSASTYIYRSSNLAAVADGKQYTCSVWVKPDAASDTAIKSVFEIDTGGGAFRVRLYKESSDIMTFVARNSAGTLICQGQNTNVVRSTSNMWYHVFLSVDLSDPLKRHFMINGVENRNNSTDWPTYTDDAMNILNSQQNIGSNPPATEQYRGALSELWVDDVYVSDVSKFYCTGRPVNVGATGSTPTGSAPAIYLSRNGSGNSWATDSSGNGNTFNLQNALGSTTPP